MFQKIRIQLTLIHSVVFIVLIASLGIVIYSFVSNNVYQDIDRSLVVGLNNMIKPNTPHPSGPISLPEDLRITMIVWDEDKKIIESLSDPRMIFRNLENIYPSNMNEIEEMKIGDYYYRTIGVKLEGTNYGVVTIQALRSVTSEKEMLHTLVLILVIGCGIGSLCAIGLGYFLAGKALIPIKKSWQKQQQFVSDASHELRTPLAVIQTKTDLLFQAPNATIKEKAPEISSISREVRRLSKLVGNLLTLARSDSDILEVNKNLFLLDKKITEIVEHYREFAMIQEKTLTSEIDTTVDFFGDQEMIHQLLIILLDNAMKYTEPSGKIHVSCEEINNQIAVKVADSGIGIAEEHLSRIFDRFYQVDKARTDESGVGLGLSIAKWIVDKHQGKIKVTSQIGEGTCFEIQFPKNQKER